MGLVERIARRAAGWLLAAALCVALMVQALTHGPAAPDDEAWSIEAIVHGHAHAVAGADDSGDAPAPPHDASDHKHQTLALLPPEAGLPLRPDARAGRRRGWPAKPSAREGPKRPPRRPSA